MKTYPCPAYRPVFVTEVKVAGRPIEVFDTLFKIESSFRAKIIALEVGSFPLLLSSHE